MKTITVNCEFASELVCIIPYKEHFLGNELDKQFKNLVEGEKK